MPLPTEELTPQSTDQEITDAINAAVRQLIDEGLSPTEAVSQAVESAKAAAGRVPQAGQRVQTYRGGINETA